MFYFSKNRPRVSKKKIFLKFGYRTSHYQYFESGIFILKNKTMKTITRIFFAHTDTPADFGLLVIRIVFSLVLLYGHGWGKLSVILSGQEIQFMDPIGLGAKLSYYLAAFAEGICAILLILGLFSRFAATVLTLNFIVILFFHAFLAKDGFEVLEMRYLYLAVFFALIFTGAGRYSIDYVTSRKGVEVPM